MMPRAPPPPLASESVESIESPAATSTRRWSVVVLVLAHHHPCSRCAYAPWTRITHARAVSLVFYAPSSSSSYVRTYVCRRRRRMSSSSHDLDLDLDLDLVRRRPSSVGRSVAVGRPARRGVFSRLHGRGHSYTVLRSTTLGRRRYYASCRVVHSYTSLARYR